MSFPPSNPPGLPLNELAQVKQRLLQTRSVLQQLCRDLEVQIQALDHLSAATPAVHAPPPNLFETSPASGQPAMIPDIAPPGSRVIKAAAPSAVDPELEQATLEELNAALSRAFSQIANRQQW
jgi:hypothetical protein